MRRKIVRSGLRAFSAVYDVVKMSISPSYLQYLYKEKLRMVDLYSPMSFNSANRQIGKSIDEKTPFMASRLGMSELNALIYLEKQIAAMRLESVVARKLCSFEPLRESILRELTFNAGFFPLTDASLLSFHRIMIESLSTLDIIGSWVPGENLFVDYMNNPLVVNRIGLIPFLADTPWTKSLAGKTVLVIHPFIDTIRRQYAIRDQLFSESKCLPDFNLKLLKPPQTAGGGSGNYDSWEKELFATLDKAMLSDCDIAIIGCGSYGFPLSALLKENGIAAVHLGGATQLMFGIRGKRWDQSPTFSAYYNEHWIRPLESDLSEACRNIEGGCYV